MGPVAGKAVRKKEETKQEKILRIRRKDYDAMKDNKGFHRPGSLQK